MGKLTLFKVGKLIDGNGGDPISNGIIIVENDRIKKIGDEKSVNLKEFKIDEEISLGGEICAMPGMMDLHIHLCMYNNLTFKNYRVAQWEITPELQQMYMLFHAQLCLDRGMTTLRDLGLMSNRGLLTQQSTAVKTAIENNILAGPRLITGAFTVGTGSHLDLINPRGSLRNPKATADGPDELRKLARLNLLQGADWLKTCASGGGGTDKEEPDVRNHTQEELDAVCDEAHALHAYCSIHCFTPDAHRMALKAGADTIEHMVFHDQDSLEKLVESQIPVTPTLSHRTDHAIEIRREIGTPSFTLEKMKRIQPNCFETFQAFYKAGVNIAMGTDMGFEPDIGSNADELKIYVDLGMKPMEAIMTTTKNAAKALHLEKDLGTLEEGKIADIVLVKGDPSKNIEVLGKRENILMVMKDGKIHVDRRDGKDIKPFPTNYKEWRIVD